MILLMIVLVGFPILLGLWAQAKVSSAFGHWKQVAATSGLTGAEAARQILASAAIGDVEVVEINDMLGDHYDPTTKRLCLSTDVYRTPSVAALGIAAHECGHAIQHARAYAPLKLRMAIVPVTTVVSSILPFVMMAAFIVPIAHMVAFKLLILVALCYAVMAVFQLITLPVEFDASRRAKAILGEMRIIQPGEEAAGVNNVLDSAALTYVAAFVAVLGQLLYYVMLLFGNRSEER